MGAIIKVGDRVEISLKRLNNSRKYFASQVLDYDPLKKKLIIYSPISLGQTIYLPANEVYTFFFYATPMPVSCEGQTVRHYKEGDIELTEILVTSDEFEKAQRREYFRLEAIIPFQYTKVDEEGEPIEDPPVMYSGLIKNLSAGGLRFAGNTELERGSTLMVIIPLDKNKISTQCKVVNQQRLISNSGVYKFEISVQFTKISHMEREFITRYIFEGQRQLLQKGRTQARLR